MIYHSFFATGPRGHGDARPFEARADEARFELVGAVYSRREFLVGPSFRDPEGEALLLAPPGVRIPAPEGSAETMSTHDWRVALWPADEDGNCFVDVGCPSSLEPVSLAFVIDVIDACCPEYTGWLASILERRLRNAANASAPDRDGRVFTGAERWRSEALATLDELDVALSGGAPQDRLSTLESFLDGVLAGAREATPASPGRSPGDRDPRLQPGVLRSLYADLLRGHGLDPTEAAAASGADEDDRPPWRAPAHVPRSVSAQRAVADAPAHVCGRNRPTD